MARYQVIPTKTNLLRLKRDLSFAQEGYELLEQKRKILVVELMGLMDKTADAREKVDGDLTEAFKALQNTVLAMGRRAVSNIAPAVNIESDITIQMRRLMGVNLPIVEIK
ncbi:MAG TPA: V-type ATP synthase subunit D, partial [bacterium]